MKLIKKEILDKQFDCWDLEVKGTSTYIVGGMVVHNSNFSIFSANIDAENEEIRIGKKSCLIANDANFYGCQEVIEKVTPNIRALHKGLLNHSKYEFSEMGVRGEICGGWYPHPDVPKNSQATKVQDKVWYSPNNEFYGFDIMLDGLYMDTDEVHKWLERYGILNSLIFTGAFKECLECSNEFQTTIPGMLGLPPIDDNICEGIVLRPIIPAFFPCGSRVILKSKNPRFAEKENKKKTPRVQIEISPEGQELLDELRSFITENRLKNVLSHGEIETITNKDFGKLMKLYTADVWEDFEKDNKEDFEALDKDEQKRITKSLSSFAADLIREHFLNIIDNNF